MCGCDRSVQCGEIENILSLRKRNRLLQPHVSNADRVKLPLLRQKFHRIDPRHHQLSRWTALKDILRFNLKHFCNMPLWILQKLLPINVSPPTQCDQIWRFFKSFCQQISCQKYPKYFVTCVIFGHFRSNCCGYFGLLLVQHLDTLLSKEKCKVVSKWA